MSENNDKWVKLEKEVDGYKYEYIQAIWIKLAVLMALEIRDFLRLCANHISRLA